MGAWPASNEELARLQLELARAEPPPWRPSTTPVVVGGCFICFGGHGPGPGARGDPAWAGAVVTRAGRVLAGAVVSGQAGAPYQPGYLALREGPLLEAAVRALAEAPGVLLVNATARDHPRRAGLALQLGAVLDLPTIGVTHRPLLAEGPWPGEERGASAAVAIGDEVVGSWLRTRPGARPLLVGPGWRTGLDTAVEVVLEATERVRAPEPLRQARRLARTARAAGASPA